MTDRVNFSMSNKAHLDRAQDMSLRIEQLYDPEIISRIEQDMKAAGVEVRQSSRFGVYGCMRRELFFNLFGFDPDPNQGYHVKVNFTETADYLLISAPLLYG